MLTEKLMCIFCGRECKNPGGLIAHQHCCEKNPNRSKYYHSPNAGLKKGHKTWNKGLTKLTNKSVAKAANTLHEKYLNKELNPSFLGKKHSLETRKILSEIAKERHENGWDNKCGRAQKLKYLRKDGTVITVDGSWEYHVAEYLDVNNINWIRNRKRFSYVNLKNKIATYCPDFYLIDTNEYLEIKGYETELDRCKWKQFPHKLIVWKKKDLIDKNISIKQIIVPLPKSG